MSSHDQHDCVWCGSRFDASPSSGSQTCFCSECHDTYEAETHRSLHPVEERHPHND